MDTGKIIQNCDIVLDLLPMYVDGSLSTDSKALVEMHLKQCPQCRKEYQRMKADLTVDTGEIVPDTKNKGRQIIRRTVWTVVAMVSFAYVLVCGMGILYAWPSWH